MKRVWLPGRGLVCQVSPRQSFMTKYVIKPFERGAYNRSLHRPSPLKGSTWWIAMCSYPAPSSSEGMFPRQGQNYPPDRRAAPCSVTALPSPAVCCWEVSWWAPRQARTLPLQGSTAGMSIREPGAEGTVLQTHAGTDQLRTRPVLGAWERSLCVLRLAGMVPWSISPVGTPRASRCASLRRAEQTCLKGLSEGWKGVSTKGFGKVLGE